MRSTAAPHLGPATAADGAPREEATNMRWTHRSRRSIVALVSTAAVTVACGTQDKNVDSPTVGSAAETGAAGNVDV